MPKIGIEKQKKGTLNESLNNTYYENQKGKINQLEKKGTYNQYMGQKENVKRGNSLADKENRVNDINMMDKSKAIESLKKSNKITSKDMMKEQRIKESKDLTRTYGTSILEHMYKGNVHKGDFLDKHDITSKLRAKMIDWMVEVLCQYKC